jgi:hypothetical protein
MRPAIVRFSTLILLAVLACSAALAVDHASGGAATFVVTKEADTNDGTCDSDCSPREAFVAALAAGGTIQFPAGTFTLQIGGADENLSATGDFDITRDVTITGMGPDQTILDGGNLDRLIDVRDGGSLHISGLTIQHGYGGAGATAGLRADGPLWMSDVHVVNNEGDGTDNDGATAGVTVRRQAWITNSLISDNKAKGFSVGGLFATETSDVTIIQTAIESNSASGHHAVGGMVLAGGAVLDGVNVSNNTASGDGPLGGMVVNDTGEVTVRNSHFDDNDVPSGTSPVGAIINVGKLKMWDTTVDGNDTGTKGVGGILSLDNDAHTARLDLYRVMITNNSAKSGPAAGGLWIETPAHVVETTIDGNTAVDHADPGVKVFGAQDVKFERVKISNNSGHSDVTGGIYIEKSDVTITDSWIDNNIADSSATGGVYVTGNAMLTIKRSAITNNSVNAAASTGGMGVFQASAIIENVTFSGNSTVGNATGGLYLENATVKVSYSTFDDNSAGNSLGVGGLTNYGTLHIDHSILGHNPGETNCWQTAGTSDGYNVEQGTDCGFTVGTDHQSANPALGPLQDNGGFAPTQEIDSSSAAADLDAACTQTLDQRFFPRFGGTGCDSGAFENITISPLTLPFGDLGCNDHAGPEDSLALIASGAGLQPAAAPAGTCPDVSAQIFFPGWFDHHAWGDVDCDGLVTILDALTILRGSANVGSMAITACPTIGEDVDVLLFG